MTVAALSCGGVGPPCDVLAGDDDRQAIRDAATGALDVSLVDVAAA